MVEATDNRFGDILIPLVFQPLDMHHSTVAQQLPRRLRKNAAVAHSHSFFALTGSCYESKRIKCLMIGFNKL